MLRRYVRTAFSRACGACCGSKIGNGLFPGQRLWCFRRLCIPSQETASETPEKLTIAVFCGSGFPCFPNRSIQVFIYTNMGIEKRVHMCARAYKDFGHLETHQRNMKGCTKSVLSVY